MLHPGIDSFTASLRMQPETCSAASRRQIRVDGAAVEMASMHAIQKVSGTVGQAPAFLTAVCIAQSRPPWSLDQGR